MTSIFIYTQVDTMEQSDINIVTGAFSYTGSYICKKLLFMGKTVKTITGHPNRANPFDEHVEAAPFHFDDFDNLVQFLEGADTLYNTYWVRFSFGKSTFENALKNSKILIEAAEKAGIRRIVHVSITNNSLGSQLPYFKGKAEVEKLISDSKLSYATIRPTVLFGGENILINNIAYLLRNYSTFTIPGTGDYLIQPVFIEDLAEIAVNAGQENENLIIDAVGPEKYTFDELIRLMSKTIKGKAGIRRLSPSLAWLFSQIVGKFFVKDVTLTWEEVQGLMGNLLHSDSSPLGKRKFSEWLSQNADTIGLNYASELKRHYRS